MFKRVFSALLLLAFSHATFAEDAAPRGFEDTFRAGLASYQNKDFEKARAEFNQALSLEPRNTAAMTNFALTLYQLNEKGAAIAWFRRVLAVDPRQEEARAGLTFAVSQLEIKEIPHRIETFETLRDNFLQYIPLKQALVLTALLLLASGWLLLNWLGERRRTLRLKEPPPPFPFKTAFLCTVFLGMATLLLLKIYDQTIPRGTIIPPKVAAKASPSDAGVSMFDLHEGFEVIIRDVRDDWVQVTYPGGLTGWIPKQALIPTQGGGS
ncbi:MAG: tetratricopeptide repeat protein [Bdellovibrionaceae bacterium]|nr:tetratricopeptide repeat protein [Pseudobdellovibrionaceae bacterium]MBX3034133.1 tetratricopeptide repeat protein [Pseudobdellovibrionaceae bacterium]